MKRKTFALLVALAALPGVASAQTLPKDDPFRVELGAYIPTFSDGGKSVGVDVGLAYSIYRKKSFDVALAARYAYFQGDVSGFDYNADLGTYGVDVRYQPKGQKFFVGGGLAAADIHLDLGGGFEGDTTKLGYSAEAGYDFTKKLYGVVRYQATTDDIRPYRGLTVGVGYRF